MNILVILRPVRDPAGFTVNRKAQRVFVNRPTYIINPSDRNALEAALQTGAAVTVVALGGATADDVLRQALAVGASRAVRIDDPALRQADALVVVNVLRRLVTHLGGPDLILLGAEVIDSDMAQVGPRLAQALDWPLIADAHHVAIEGSSAAALASVGKEFHKYQAPVPAVITVARDSNKPRYAPGASIINIYKSKDAVERLSLADLGMAEVDLTPVTESRGESFPAERELGKRLEGDVDEMARQVAEVIRKA